MKNIIDIGWLEVSSFTYTGSIGAEHFYGKICFKNRDAIEMQKPLSAKEALYLNKKENAQSFSRYKPGELSRRFETEKQLIDFSIKWFRKNRPKGMLLRGNPASCSATSPVIYYPNELSYIAKKVNKLVKEWHAIDGYEGNEKRAEEIDNEWYALMSDHIH